MCRVKHVLYQAKQFQLLRTLAKLSRPSGKGEGLSVATGAAASDVRHTRASDRNLFAQNALEVRSTIQVTSFLGFFRLCLTLVCVVFETPRGVKASRKVKILHVWIALEKLLNKLGGTA